ncbi:uncharacterized protein LOC113798325 [Dermatophagoides pteronyssinus]|uniref:uncharacterized protein LOC113798325 n=1 Tax=Dermatophagoides pteronyssinus TaxID=6956 RepID=UPI003F66E880
MEPIDTVDDNDKWLAHFKHYLSKSSLFIEHKCSKLKKNHDDAINKIIDNNGDELNEISVEKITNTNLDQNNQDRDTKKIDNLIDDDDEIQTTKSNVLEKSNESLSQSIKDLLIILDQSIKTSPVNETTVMNNDDDEYKFHIQSKNVEKPITITVSDQKIGKKIDNFLRVTDFEGCLDMDDDDDSMMIIDQAAGGGDNLKTSKTKTAEIIRYDRDFLLQLRSNPNQINNQAKNQENYLENLMKSTFAKDLFNARLNLFRFHQ